MNFNGRRILLTGAAGGIGMELASQLLDENAHVLLTGRDRLALQGVASLLGRNSNRAAVFTADLTKDTDRAALCAFATQWRGGIDMIINNAGVSDFTLLERQSAESMQMALLVNLLAPMDLCRQLLPHLCRTGDAHIVNIGSVFGSIGFAGNAVYCATKFGMRGFSEALRRELAHSNVRVHYFAPRATRTKFNARQVDELNAALGNSSDPPELVARVIVAALRSDRLELVVGWPEQLFARLNAVLPRLVDVALRKKLHTIREFALRARTSTPTIAQEASLARKVV